MSELVAITGANSASGRALLRQVLAGAGPAVVACVRSERAAAQLPALGAPSRVAAVDFGDPASLDAAFAGVRAVVHLPGVLFESAHSRYEAVHVASTRAALAAAQRAGVGKFVLVSALGADPRSANRYYATKGEAERLVRESKLPFSVLRAPLLLGPGTEGSAALRRQLAGPRALLLGGGRQQVAVLDVADLARAVLRALEPGRAEGLSLDLAGSAPLPYRELLAQAARAARAAGRELRIGALPVPVPLLRALLALRTRWLGPGFSPEVLDVLLDEHRADPQAAARALELEWTPLAQTLRSALQENP